MITEAELKEFEEYYRRMEETTGGHAPEAYSNAAIVLLLVEILRELRKGK